MTIPTPAWRIVPAADAHVASMCALLDAVARERRHLAMVAGPSLGDTRSFLERCRASDSPYLAAVAGDRVIGWCDILRGEREGYRHGGALGMGVAADHRRAGVGRALLAGALRDARARGFERVELEVYASNEAAIALYRQAGFESEGRKRRGRILDGRVDDIIGMGWLAESAPDRSGGNKA